MDDENPFALDIELITNSLANSGDRLQRLRQQRHEAVRKRMKAQLKLSEQADVNDEMVSDLSDEQARAYLEGSEDWRYRSAYGWRNHDPSGTICYVRLSDLMSAIQEIARVEDRGEVAVYLEMREIG